SHGSADTGGILGKVTAKSILSNIVQIPSLRAVGSPNSQVKLVVAGLVSGAVVGPLLVGDGDQLLLISSIIIGAGLVVLVQALQLNLGDGAVQSDQLSVVGVN